MIGKLAGSPARQVAAVPALDVLRWTVVGLAVVHGTALLGGPLVVPYAGTLTVAALLAYAWLGSVRAPGRSRQALLSGLAALVAAAGLVDARTAGHGWPVASTDPAGGVRGALEALLLLVAAAAGCAALLGAVRVPRGRRRAVVAATLGTGAATAAVTMAVRSARASWIVPMHRSAADVAGLVAAVTPLAVLATAGAVVAVLTAGAVPRRRDVGVAWSRTAAAGLTVLAALALVMVGPVARAPQFRGRPVVPVRYDPWPVDRLRAYCAGPCAANTPPANTGAAVMVLGVGIETPPRRDGPVRGLDEMRTGNEWPPDGLRTAVPWRRSRPVLVMLVLLAVAVALTELVVPQRAP